MITEIDQLPSVVAYLRRIRATAVNFRSAKITVEDNGYPRAIGWVKFASDGTVTVTGSAELPTAAEEEAIATEISSAHFPTYVTLAAIPEAPPECSLSDPNTFICHGFDGEIAAVRQRYETPTGKGYLTWTRWSDGQWRNMEPDMLPFYGLPGYRDCSTLVLHEGEKAAARVKRLLSGEDTSRFPWLEDLKYAHHVGWIGGVHAVSRSDWATLSAKGWKRLIIVSDNDDDGIEAAAEIAPLFDCPVNIVRFGSSFPDRFDCGDPWPAHLFDGEDRYSGPAFDECLQPFDWATELASVAGANGQDRSVPVLRPSFAGRYRVAAETQQVFCIDRPAVGSAKSTFNDEVRHRSHSPNTYSLLIQHAPAMCRRRVYRPDAPPGPIVDDGHVCWNAYEPAKVRARKGDVRLWLHYLEHLFPVAAERHEVMRWLATLIALRDRRMHYSLLLVSKKQGVGKSTLGAILKRLLGATNVSFPGDSALDSQFNPWASGKLLIFVNEIYTNGNAKVYDRLKSYVSDEDIPINEKNIPQYTVQNWAVFAACSNSEKALFLPDDDRRWFVPTVTNKLRDRREWEALHRWIDAGGVELIKSWADDFAREHSVLSGERPPATSAKRAIVAASKSEGRLLARDFGEEFAGMEPAIIRISDLRAWIAEKRGIDVGHANLEKERLIIEELEGVDGLHVWKGDARPKIGGRRGSKAAVVFNFPPEGQWAGLEALLKTMRTLGFGSEL